MKAFPLVVLITSLFIINIKSTNDICDNIYKCADLENNVCKYSTYNQTSGITVHSLQKCNSTSHCTKSSSSNHTCASNPKLPNKHGETCETNSDCYGTCDTSSKKCIPLQDYSSCTTHFSCNYTSYCNEESSKCIPLKKADDNCFDNEECPLGYLCGKLQDDSKKCIKMFSIEIGEYANEDVLCKSGKKTDRNICVEITSENQGNECTKDEECPCVYDIKTQQEKSVVECKCNLEGKKYCEYGSSSDEWTKFVETFNEEINDVDVNSFYTAGLRGNENGDYSEEELKNKFWKINSIQNAYKNYDVKYKNVDSCVIEFFKNAQYVKLPIAFITILLAFIL